MPTIVGVNTSTTAFVGRTLNGPVGSPMLVESFPDFTTAFGAVWSESPMTSAVQQFFENGGSSAIIVRASGADPDKALTSIDILGSREDNTGVYALVDSSFNLLCLPPPAAGVDIDSTTWTEAAKLCLERRAMLLVDAPDATPALVSTTGAALIGDESARKNAGLFYPRLIALAAPGPSTPPAKFVPCGVVAGIFARTDFVRGVWKASAGLDARLTAARPSRSLSNSDNARLNSSGVNCIRTFPNVGTVLWGSRTMDGADGTGSEWKYIPVRRTALFIEQSVEEGLQWSIAEPNEAALWSRVSLDVSSFMHRLWVAGAFTGRTAKEAYLVRCDALTTTPDDIQNRRMNVTIGFAPLRPAEFIILRIAITRAA